MRALHKKLQTAERAFSRLPAVRACRDILGRTARDPEKVLQFSVRASALCIIISLVISQNMWFQDHRVLLPTPLFAWAAALPDGLNGLFYWALLGINGFLLIAPQYRRAGLAAIPIYVFLVLQDAVRWQFYLYMQFFNLLAAGMAPRKVTEAHLDPMRYMLIGVYFWSGVYKLNPYFIKTLFPWFVSAWFPFADVARVIGVGVPFLEAGIAVFLLAPRTRPLGQLLATGMLIVVMLSLGPTGLNRDNFVWPANFYMDALAILLFMDRRRLLWKPAQLKAPASALALLLFVASPGLGITNTLGHHQSFKLFCCLHHTHMAGTDAQLNDRLVADTGLRLRLNITVYPVWQTAAPYVSGVTGVCPYLSHPENAKMEVFDDAFPFWSDRAEKLVYGDICSGHPRLLSREVLKP